MVEAGLLESEDGPFRRHPRDGCGRSPNAPFSACMGHNRSAHAGLGDQARVAIGLEAGSGAPLGSPI
jgi:hypothetical protein